MDYQVCFIQGDWLLPSVWEKFERHFKACGYACSVLTLPVPGELGWCRVLQARSVGSSPLGRLVDFYAAQIAALPAPPVLIGHALGGLIVQLLLDRGVGMAGVAIAPLPPQGVVVRRLSWLHMLSLLQILSAKTERLGNLRFMSITPAQLCRRVAHPASPQACGPLHHQLVGRVPQQLMATVMLGVGSRLFFEDERGALLLISGGDDRMVASSVVLANYCYQRRSLAPTDFMAFPGYGHLLITQPGWEHVADRIIEWLQHQLGKF